MHEAELTQRTANAERRRTLRRGVQTTIQVRDGEGFRIQGQVVDLSVTGCKVAFRKGLGLTPGETYTITLGGIVLDAGCVSWSVQGLAGIEFLKPIYAPVLEDIVRRFPSALSAKSSGGLQTKPPQ
ncbi:MAG: PilZ domain-containing protein [Pseudomonadota bacterium]